MLSPVVMAERARKEPGVTSSAALQELLKPEVSRGEKRPFVNVMAFLLTDDIYSPKLVVPIIVSAFPPKSCKLLVVTASWNLKNSEILLREREGVARDLRVSLRQ